MSDISIKNIHTFLSGEGKALTGEEEKFLNTIFKDVDKEDKEGKLVGNNDGDGFLNNNEWSQFKSALKTGYKAIYDKLSSYIKKTNDNIEYDYFAPNKTFDPDMYTMEALQKRFPNDKYTIESDGEFTTITEKNTNNLVLDCAFMDGEYSLMMRKNQNEEFYLTYNTNNLIESEQYKNNGTLITNTIYDYDAGTKNINGNNIYDINTGRAIQENKNGFMFFYDEKGNYSKTDLKTGEQIFYNKDDKELDRRINTPVLADVIRKCKSEEELDELLNTTINENNALQILGTPSIIKALGHYMDFHTKIEGNILMFSDEGAEKTDNTTKKIFETAITQAQKEGIYVNDIKNSTKTGYYSRKLLARYNAPKLGLKNEPITKDTKIEQGETGDCWLLEKIIGLAQTENGLNILNNMYEPQKDSKGNITSVKVWIQDNEYDIPIDEINGANELSSGNLYVRAIEIGVFKYMQECRLETVFGYEDDEIAKVLRIGGGTSSMGSDILVGSGITLKDEDSAVPKPIDKSKPIDDDFMQELMNTQNAIIGVSTAKGGFKGYVVETGELENIVSHHAYSVIGKDDEYIYLVEPSNNKKTLRMTYEEFKNCFEKGDITPIKQPQENDEKVFTQSGAIFVEFTKEQYSQMLNNPDKKEEIYKNQEQKIKAELQERFDISKYTVNVIYNGRYFEYSILPKQR